MATTLYTFVNATIIAGLGDVVKCARHFVCDH